MTKSKNQPKYWCVNFDGTPILKHGIGINSWLMQYQYEHGGYTYQTKKKTNLTKAWNAVRAVSTGDWLLAYLSHKTFYAIGEVISPRAFSDVKAVVSTDEVARTLSENSHHFFKGLVRYTDAPMFYEDFSDRWNYKPQSVENGDPPTFPYAQRIDVASWKHFNQNGVIADGLANASQKRYRQAIFQINKDFFDVVSAALK